MKPMNHECGWFCRLFSGLDFYSSNTPPTNPLLPRTTNTLPMHLQEEVMNRWSSCQDELIMFSYLCGTVYVAAFCLFSGELVPGLVFLHGQVSGERERER